MSSLHSVYVIGLRSWEKIRECPQSRWGDAAREDARDG